MLRMKFAAAVAASLLVASIGTATAAETAGPDDTARFLAGMPPSSGSPLVPLTRDRTWQQHAHSFDSAFANVDRPQLSRIRAWSSATLHAPRSAVFYMFSGPDFLYVNAFFPNASTYVLSGLEPVGQVPELTALPRGSIAYALATVERSLSSVLALSFFITRDMRVQLVGGRVNGTLPILYVFLARAGKTIRAVEFVKLDEQGAEHPAAERGIRSLAPGVKIVFAGSDGREQTLYYFSTNLDNDGVRRSGFLQFCEKLGPGDSFVKSASYLLHSGGFSSARRFLLEHSALVLQDDSGVPVSQFDKDKWRLRPFGHYAGPIPIFARFYQPRLSDLFRRGRPSPIDFGVGYRWRPHESNLLLAERESAKTGDQR
jgi:hypothetical protein